MTYLTKLKSVGSVEDEVELYYIDNNTWARVDHRQLKQEHTFHVIEQWNHFEMILKNILILMITSNRKQFFSFCFFFHVKFLKD